MLRSFLIGLVGGMRSMTPLAVVSDAARRGALPRGHGGPRLLASPMVATGTAVLAAAELFGDKLASAPDRTVVPGMLARVVTGAVCGAALAPRDQRASAALFGAAGAVAAAYVTFDARMTALRRFGQVPTGVVEDAIAVAAAVLIVNGAAAANDRRRLR